MIIQVGSAFSKQCQELLNLSPICGAHFFFSWLTIIKDSDDQFSNRAKCLEDVFGVIQSKIPIITSSNMAD
jgi:hypothetical protein